MLKCSRRDDPDPRIRPDQGLRCLGKHNMCGRGGCWLGAPGPLPLHTVPVVGSAHPRVESSMTGTTSVSVTFTVIATVNVNATVAVAVVG